MWHFSLSLHSVKMQEIFDQAKQFHSCGEFFQNTTQNRKIMQGSACMIRILSRPKCERGPDMAGRVCRPGPARPFSQKPEPNFLGSGTWKSEFFQKPDPGFTRPCLLCYITYSLPDPTDPFLGCQTLITFRVWLPDPTWLGRSSHRVRHGSTWLRVSLTGDFFERNLIGTI